MSIFYREGRHLHWIDRAEVERMSSQQMDDWLRAVEDFDAGTTDKCVCAPLSALPSDEKKTPAQ